MVPLRDHLGTSRCSGSTADGALLSFKEVKLKGHSHATNIHYYTKVGGVWKFAGLKPTVRWNEHEFEKVFKGSYAQTDEMEMQIPIRERDSGLKNGILVTACELGSIESTVSV